MTDEHGFADSDQRAFFDRLALRAATIDELLSDAFEALPGQKRDADLAGRRLAAWCRASASGEWGLFNRRLQRDGLSLDGVLARLATVRRRGTGPRPEWIADAIWIDTALRRPPSGSAGRDAPCAAAPAPFEELFLPLAEEADTRLWSLLDAAARATLTPTARACLRSQLLQSLCDLCAAALYDRFAAARRSHAAEHAKPAGPGAETLYGQFIDGLRGDGLRRLFEEKPVLLRLTALLTRQWLGATSEFVARLAADLQLLHDTILAGHAGTAVARIGSGLSDPHHGGRSVLTVEFEGGARVMYKPKDMRVDAACHGLVARLNRGGAPIDLRAATVVACDGYGWMEFVEHAGCADAEGCRRFFRRAGAWLAMLHVCAGTDVHHENMIAAGEHPVPIDLETLLHAAERGNRREEAQGPDAAIEAARDVIADSVMAVGLLPSYGRSADNGVVAVGGVASASTGGTVRAWADVNSDAMRPTMQDAADQPATNLPHCDGRYAGLGDYLDDFVAGFTAYAAFLRSQAGDPGLLEGLRGLPVRRVIRPTQFYAMLLDRLRDDRTMGDGALWSAQADFLARLADWEQERDPLWPLQRSERSALLSLDVPRFVMRSDGDEVSDTAATSVPLDVVPGFESACVRLRRLDDEEIGWQADVIRQSSSFVSKPGGTHSLEPGQRDLACVDAASAPTRQMLIAEADAVAAEVARLAVRKGPGAAWIGLGWLRDSEVGELAVLGPELYNGVGGIAVFLAAHARAIGCAASAELAHAAMLHVRKELRSRGAARMARSLGLGAATGLGSVVYALAVVSRLLRDDGLLSDARAAADLFSDDLVAADRQLDVTAGSAGAILCLLRLHRDTRDDDVLALALRCGEHLLRQPRAGPVGRRSWRTPGPHLEPLNGMSHGAAGFALALASLAAATGRQEFGDAAAECIAFENASLSPDRGNWPDLREAEPSWRSQWCHGAVGIGLARLAMARHGGLRAELAAEDVGHALGGASQGWPGHVDTLCCGSLGSIELFHAAGRFLGRPDLRELASRRLTSVLRSAAAGGDFRWNAGERRFNLGLFRGLAGVGYTCLRHLDETLPNVLVWE